MKIRIKMAELKIDYQCPEPGEVSANDVSLYYEAIAKRYGKKWCGDCKFYDGDCGKGHRPRTYPLEIGPSDSVTIRKNCKDFSLFTESGADTAKGIRRQIGAALDCHVQRF